LTVPEEEQPFTSVPLTVNVVVADGPAEVVSAFGLTISTDGVHAYVVAPEVISIIESPSQTADTLAEAVTTGSGFTTTAIESLFVHPFTSVPVTT
jgi:hypothetical protein